MAFPQRQELKTGQNCPDFDIRPVPSSRSLLMRTKDPMRPNTKQAADKPLPAAQLINASTKGFRESSLPGAACVCSRHSLCAAVAVPLSLSLKVGQPSRRLRSRRLPRKTTRCSRHLRCPKRCSPPMLPMQSVHRRRESQQVRRKLTKQQGQGLCRPCQRPWWHQRPRAYPKQRPKQKQRPNQGPSVLQIPGPKPRQSVSRRLKPKRKQKAHQEPRWKRRPRVCLEERAHQGPRERQKPRARSLRKQRMQNPGSTLPKPKPCKSLLSRRWQSIVHPDPRQRRRSEPSRGDQCHLPKLQLRSGNVPTVK